MKTIVKDTSLLTSEQIEDAQAEHDARHHAKLRDTKEICETKVSSDPNAAKKFGDEQVETCFSSHQKATMALRKAVETKKDEGTAKSKAVAKSADKAKTVCGWSR